MEVLLIHFRIKIMIKLINTPKYYSDYGANSFFLSLFTTRYRLLYQILKHQRMNGMQSCQTEIKLTPKKSFSMYGQLL